MEHGEDHGTREVIVSNMSFLGARDSGVGGWLLRGLALLLVASLAACGDGNGNSGQSTVRLAQNAWLGSQLDATVAQILLEEQLGYRTEIVPVDENAQWDLLAAGDLDASLEVWPSGHAADIERYIDEEGSVENGGPLGPIGRIGWYVPSYVIAEHPSLATWEGFEDPAAAALFETPASGGHGQFLGGDPTFTQYDADIIRNLGLDFQVVYAGSEDAIIDALKTAVEQHQPLLFYFWTPHPVQTLFDLARVALPPYSDECYAMAEAGGVDCDYPPDRLFKILWPGLATEAPAAYQFLRDFNYRTEDQLQMIHAVEVDGNTPEQAARQWIDANEAVWQEWIP
jgi:glycine betaine/proline transport system substrate-binding protein